MKLVSKVVSWGCQLMIIFGAVFLVAMLFKINWLKEIAMNNLGLPIQWGSVQDVQLYFLWGIVAVTLTVGAMGLYFLHLAFANFARGELFNLSNSVCLKRFSTLLLLQTALKPIAFTLSSVVLSLNHPAGQKILSFSFGSQDFFSLWLALILWVISELLVLGNELQAENRQFV